MRQREVLIAFSKDMVDIGTPRKPVRHSFLDSFVAVNYWTALDTTETSTATLDRSPTSVWVRRLGLRPSTPTAQPFTFDMATVTRSMSVSVTELPSPASSTSSLVTQQTDAEVPRCRSRARRSAARPVLRSAFKSFTGVVPVIVGDSNDKSRPQTQYMVHKELLTAASPFFAAAFNGSFAEGLDQVVRLPEERPEIFEWFLQWLYTGTLTTPIAGSFGSNVSTPTSQFELSLNQLVAPDTMMQMDGELRNSAGSPKYFLLIDLWAFSDRMLTTPLSNHILSTIARLSESTNSVPTPSDTCILFDTIREEAPIRTLILDLFAYKKTDKLLETHKDEWHPKFLRELVVKLKRPGPEAITRHSLVAWRPRSWSTSKACEGCHETLKPGMSADKCCSCEKAFCGTCLRRHGESGGWTIAHDMNGCKPWMGNGLCARYHEHIGGEACA
ncbi:Hypothetical protein R9X50_00091100 [Acrodontium crateriforme]|uniref:BTB domain-containing protein n=1 Tax=Acrodontium crateriforme TaxID=150365 RepID=A0AAQ3R7E9_9PEZI|nr:Hypothetical protein R9X50_00091100 [Acrodontium crateriforme]